MLRHFPKISLHPKFAAVVDALISSLFLWWFSAVETPRMLIIWFVVRLILWILEVNVIYFPPGLKRISHLASAVLFQAGLIALLIFVDWKVAWYVGASMLVCGPAVSLWLLPAEEKVLSFDIKPYRRWGALSAVAIFQILAPFPWWLSIVGAALATAIAGWWWREYDIALTKRWAIMLVIFFVALLELAIPIFWWPLGYLVTGIVLAWWWYVMWLIARFYLSPEGIDLMKQRLFLIGNAILMAIYLVAIVRWR